MGQDLNTRLFHGCRRTVEISDRDPAGEDHSITGFERRCDRLRDRIRLVNDRSDVNTPAACQLAGGLECVTV